MMRNKGTGMDPDYVNNMDQVLIQYPYHASHTWEKKGVNTIHVWSSNTDTKRTTVAVTVSASEKLLHPMLIFKGNASGLVEKNDFEIYPQECIYAFQPKAWMGESMMNLWINEVLIPWKNTKDTIIVPLLILDTYRVHMMGRIVNCIQALVFEVQHILSCCTYLCQLVDNGFNKPIKKEKPIQGEDWMTGGRVT
jgi:hypothetical protein